MINNHEQQLSTILLLSLFANDFIYTDNFRIRTGPIICISHINSIGIYISKPCHLKGVSSDTENSKWSTG